MSLKAMLAVFEHSRATGAARLVLLAIADHAHDDGTDAYPAIGTIAHKARVSRRGAQKAIERLRDLGELAIEGQGPKGTHQFRMILPTLGGGEQSSPLGANRVHGGGEQSDTQGANRVRPNQDLEPSLNLKTVASKNGNQTHPQTHVVMTSILREGVRYPSGIVGRLGKQVKAALLEGQQPGLVIVAGRDAMRRGRPELLPNLIAERLPLVETPVPEAEPPPPAIYPEL